MGLASKINSDKDGKQSASHLPDSCVGRVMKKDLSIYIHIPFCLHKCVYCDFLSFAGRSISDQVRYVSAINNEIRLYKPFASRYLVKTIYFGGGTPSLIDESLIESMLETIRDTFEVDRFAEITIEANPGTLKYADLLQYREFGINRLSIGMQTADDELLKKLGRIHDFEGFEKCFQDARRAGFENISVDLMSGIPGQSIHSYVDTLTRVTELNPEHISSYSLQVEEGTPLANNAELLSEIPDESIDREMYAMTKRVLSASGYERYEFSNYAKPGYESRHNHVYWTGGEYIGLGISAASLFKGERFTNIRDVEEYMQVLTEAGDEISNGTSPELLYEAAAKQLRTDITVMYVNNRMEEFMFLGLRLIKGVSRADFRSRFGKDMFSVFGPVINKYSDQGFIEYNDARVWFTDKGIDVSNYILADFLLDQ